MTIFCGLSKIDHAMTRWFFSLHCQVQELQDALAELRVNCADEMEAFRNRRRFRPHATIIDITMVSKIFKKEVT